MELITNTAEYNLIICVTNQHEFENGFGNIFDYLPRKFNRKLFKRRGTIAY